ncbi:unnamed protein product, partial [Musa acuminata var. zebrina]
SAKSCLIAQKVTSLSDQLLRREACRSVAEPTWRSKADVVCQLEIGSVWSNAARY